MHVRNDDALVQALVFDSSIRCLSKGIDVRRLLMLVAPFVRKETLIREKGIYPSKRINRNQHRPNVGIDEVVEVALFQVVANVLFCNLGHEHEVVHTSLLHSGFAHAWLHLV